MDYMFMHEAQSESEECGMPILVAKDLVQYSCGNGMVFARVVPSKGVQSYAVKSVASDIASLGHPEMVLKSDGEPAIVALKMPSKWCARNVSCSSRRQLVVSPSRTERLSTPFSKFRANSGP